MTEVIRVKSRMARRAVGLGLFVAAMPLTLALIVLHHAAKDQILWTARTLERVNNSAIDNVAKRFHVVGREQASQMAADSVHLSKTALQRSLNGISAKQADLMAAGSRRLTMVSAAGLDQALSESRRVQSGTVAAVRAEMEKMTAAAEKLGVRSSSGTVERAILDKNDEVLQGHAQLIARQIDSRARGARTILETLARTEAFQTGNVREEEDLVHAVQSADPTVSTVDIMDIHGKCAAGGDIVGEQEPPPNNTLWFKRASAGTSAISIQSDPADGDVPFVRVSVPVLDSRNQVKSIITSRIALNDIWESAESATIGRYGYIYMLPQDAAPLESTGDGDNNVVESRAIVGSVDWQVVAREPLQEALTAATQVKQEFAGNSRDSIARMWAHIQASATRANANARDRSVSIQQRMRSRIADQSGFVVRSLTAGNTTLVQRQVEWSQRHLFSDAVGAQAKSDRQMENAVSAASLKITADSPRLTQEALKRADHHLTLVVCTVGLLSCLGGGLLAVMFTDKIARPVILLRDAIRAVSNGDLQAKVPADAPEEIGELAEAFNNMTESLKRSRFELATTEGQLIQSAKLASLGTLSAGVAHELNQPVAIIRGMIQQVRDDDRIPQDVLEDLTLIEGQTSRMMKIILHLRTFSRRENGIRNPVDINQVIEDGLMLVGQQLRTYGITIEMKLAEGLPVVMADANELEQVFLNLVTNARDAMEGRENAQLTISTFAEQGKVVAEFWDNGTGIPEEILPTIFDPFFTTKDAGRGTGLGLSISHTIIQRHEGDITVENRGGAAFRIALPAAADNQQQELPAAGDDQQQELPAAA